ncbi:hypothetical protein N0B40_16925 [Chryseobacterium oranimense]|uniref:hypothetical protein n=1 Tax=Chryseobacterium oranimense TaxID=421058 RepID=UPI0021AFDF98|nr:hypothetical protein [Chryseobacterium oranimense]UWX60076.1 hypothetical protein N0B40_16925 [Chryseobacterium oranimense]
MKKLVRILLLMTLFCAQNFFAQTKILQPEQVFALYFDTFVKQDEQSLNKLNSYLLPFLGTENTYSMDLKKSYHEEVQYLTTLFLADLPKEKADVCKQDAEAYYNALLNNLKNTRYTLKSVREVKNEFAENSFVMELSVDLIFSVPENPVGLKPVNIKRMTPGELQNYLKKQVKAFSEPGKEVTVHQIFKLYQVKKDGNTYYWNGGPQELVWKLNDSYFKSFN